MFKFCASSLFLFFWGGEGIKFLAKFVRFFRNLMLLLISLAIALKIVIGGWVGGLF